MTILPIIKYGDSILRRKVSDITDFSNIQSLIDDMFESMYKERGVGLAANQVGIPLNILILDVSQFNDELDLPPEPMTMINIKIIESSGECIMEEGCLSIPEIRAEITRPEEITVKYVDVNEKSHTESFTGLISRVIQHEVDHLNGKFFTDYLPPVKSMMIQKRLLEIADSGKPSTGIIL